MFTISCAYAASSLDVIVCEMRQDNVPFGTFVMLGAETICDCTLPVEFADNQHVASSVRDALETAVGAGNDFYPDAFACAISENGNALPFVPI